MLGNVTGKTDLRLTGIWGWQRLWQIPDVRAMMDMATYREWALRARCRRMAGRDAN